MNYITPEVIEALMDETISMLGPNGEHWIKHQASDMRGSHCALGAFSAARNIVYQKYLAENAVSYNALDRDLVEYARGIALPLAREIALEMYPTRVLRWNEDEVHAVAQLNDHPETEFEDMRSLLEKLRARLLEDVA